MTTRRLFFFERFLMAGGRRPWNVFLVARLPGAVEPGALVGALSALQAHHPMLRVTVVPHRRHPHFTQPVPLPPIPLRVVSRAGDADWFAVVQEELERPFATGTDLLVRAVWVRSPACGELVLVADHCICDGRSMLLLMRELVEELVAERGGGGVPAAAVPCRPPQPTIDTIHDLFPPGIGRGAAHRPDRPSGPGLLRHAAALGWILRAAASVGRRVRPSPAVSPPYVLRWELPAPATAALSARCRTERVTAYTALAAAFLRAVRVVRPRHSRNRLLCPVDVRTEVPGLGPNTLFGYPATIALSLASRLNRDVWAQTRSMRRDLLDRKARLDPRRTLLTGERLHGLLDWFVALQLHGRPRNDLMYSHLGDAALPRPAAGSGQAEMLGFLSSMPWRGTPAIFSSRDGGVMRFFLVACEDTLPREEAGRIRDLAMADILTRIAGPPGDRPGPPAALRSVLRCRP
ncbi:MAG: hypothetical protein INR65_12145 [Gluconacetobacter diazotrophicus]|nr:hypothetical protein [Gluconacetobacter diazotrophicus]